MNHIVVFFVINVRQIGKLSTLETQTNGRVSTSDLFFSHLKVNVRIFITILCTRDCFDLSQIAYQTGLKKRTQKFFLHRNRHRSLSEFKCQLDKSHTQKPTIVVIWLKSAACSCTTSTGEVFTSRFIRSPTRVSSTSTTLQSTFGSIELSRNFNKFQLLKQLRLTAQVVMTHHSLIVLSPDLNRFSIQVEKILERTELDTEPNETFFVSSTQLWGFLCGRLRNSQRLEISMWRAFRLRCERELSRNVLQSSHVRRRCAFGAGQGWQTLCLRFLTNSPSWLSRTDEFDAKHIQQLNNWSKSLQVTNDGQADRKLKVWNECSIISSSRRPEWNQLTSLKRLQN